MHAKYNSFFPDGIKGLNILPCQMLGLTQSDGKQTVLITKSNENYKIGQFHVYWKICQAM